MYGELGDPDTIHSAQGSLLKKLMSVVPFMDMLFEVKAKDDLAVLVRQ